MARLASLTSQTPGPVLNLQERRPYATVRERRVSPRSQQDLDNEPRLPKSKP